MKRTYLDAGVLISAAPGTEVDSRRADAVFDDPNRFFLASIFVRREVEPKAIYYRNDDEVAFYENYFAVVGAWADPPETVIRRAEDEARRFGLSALDALHVAAAVLLGADELVTTERPRKPIHRVTGVHVVRL